MLTGSQIAETNLTDWRQLGQGLRARYVVRDFGNRRDRARARHRALRAHRPGMGCPADGEHRGPGSRDDSQAPSYTVIADQDGNKACVCTALPAAQER